MGIIDIKCSRCGARMAQTGSERGMATYHCNCCGNNEFFALSVNDNAEYWHKRSELLGRIRRGIDEWEITQWDSLRNDILGFVSAHEAARGDIYFKIAHVACLTKGFRNMDSYEYKETKQIFKATEKVYKRYLKEADSDAQFSKETGSEGFSEYESYRALYKKCRNEYRNEKLAWRVVFFVTKRFIPTPKL